MASLRETFHVVWDDRDPVTVTTTVADLIDAVDAVAERGLSNNRVALETILIHIALVRTGHSPPPYDDWLNVLDSYDKVDNNISSNGARREGPTGRARSGPARSSSPASRARRGGRGSTDETPAP